MEPVTALITNWLFIDMETTMTTYEYELRCYDDDEQ